MKHFELQEVMDNVSGEEWTMYVKTAEPYVEPPHYVDKDMAISKLKNVKTTGHDEIPVEFITEGGKELKVIYELISKICVEEIVSYEWKHGIIVSHGWKHGFICPIHKGT